MRPEQVCMDDELHSGISLVTRRRVLAAALAMTVIGGASVASPAFAQDATPPAGEIQVGTTEDAATVEGQAEAGSELPAADDAATDDQTREERRAAREAEEGVGAATVGAVPSTGVGAALGSTLGGVMGAIGLAAASVGAALYTRRGAPEDEVSEP